MQDFGEYLFGYPDLRRIEEISKRLNDQRQMGKVTTIPINYQGMVQNLPVIDVPIELPVYRIENIRTKTLQKEWIAQNRNNPDYPDLIEDDYFSRDPFSIKTQETQHHILKKIIHEEGLLKLFQNPKQFQIEPIICSNDGIVVNGNRRLCTWRELYYSNRNLYQHLQLIHVVLLPNSDRQAMYDLEVALQITPDYRSQYTWHAKAADDIEQLNHNMSISEIAQRKQMKEEEIWAGIACYRYAENYLEKIGHKDEWSLVDKEQSSIGQIVKAEYRLREDTLHKNVFSEIAHSILVANADGDRKYSFIQDVAKNINDVTDRLIKKFDIPPASADDNDDPGLIEDVPPKDKQILKLTGKLKEIDDSQLKVDAVKEIVETIKALARESKKIESVFVHVQKAATELSNAKILSQEEGMSKDGIFGQIESIEGSLAYLKQWLER